MVDFFCLPCPATIKVLAVNLDIIFIGKETDQDCVSLQLDTDHLSLFVDGDVLRVSW